MRGVPIIKYEAVIEGEVPVGLGPLHTQYDGKGFAYTSMFIDSNITKWKLPPWSDDEKKDLNKVVLDKMPMHFNIGHLVVAGSDTKEPYGKWLRGDEQALEGPPLSMSGPSQPESSQLIDISGDKMKMVAEAFTEPEPHFAQILKVECNRADRSLSEGGQQKSERRLGQRVRRASRAPATRSWSK